MLTAYALLHAVFEPRAAALVVAILSGSDDPQRIASRLGEICHREAPHCRLRGLHVGDLGASGAAWRRAVAGGLLEPQRCPWHRLEAGPWSTSGPFGMMRAFSLAHVGCAPAWVLDVPLVSAWVALQRMTAPRCALVRRCRSWAGLPGAAGPNDLHARAARRRGRAS